MAGQQKGQVLQDPFLNLLRKNMFLSPSIW